MLIDSQNLTIQLLYEKIDLLQFSQVGNILIPQTGHSLNPQADIFIPSCDFAPEDVTSAQPISLAELIPAEDSFSTVTDIIGTLLHTPTVDDPPTVEPSTLVAIDEVHSYLQRVEAALANKEQILEDMKTEFAIGLCPDKFAPRVVDQVLKGISFRFPVASDMLVFADNLSDLLIILPDAVWCFVPAEHLFAVF